MAKKKKPLSPPAKLALARAEHARAKKALDKAAETLDKCKICNADKLESEVEKLAKKHGVAAAGLKRALRGEPSPAKGAAKKRSSKKRAKAAAPAAPKKASKKRSSKKAAKKRSSKTTTKKAAKKRGKKAAKKK